MNKTILMSAIALAVSVAFVSAGIAQQKPAPAPPAPAQAPAAPAAPAKQNWEKATGVIEKVDEATKEVVVQTQKEKTTFSAGENTRITEGTTKTQLSGLKKGMGVTVEYKKEGNKLLAEWIDVNAAKAETKPTAQAQAKETKEVKKEAKKENPSEKSMEKK
jgi:Cu/Ag efflux protein CusF